LIINQLKLIEVNHSKTALHVSMTCVGQNRQVSITVIVN